MRSFWSRLGIDAYTPWHLALGTLYYDLGLTAGTTVLLAFSWEMLEGPLKERAPQLFPVSAPEPMLNHVVDAGSVVAGYFLGRFLFRLMERRITRVARGGEYKLGWIKA